MKPCILLVDDDPSVRRSLARLLRAHDYEAMEAENAGMALTVLATRRPALLLIDMVMPGEDTLQTVRTIKREPRTAALPIIALTASPPMAPSDQSLFADILPKPSEARALLEAIERALRSAAAIRPAP